MSQLFKHETFLLDKESFIKDTINIRTVLSICVVIILKVYIDVHICDNRIIDGAQDFMCMMSGNDTFCKLLSDTMNFIKQRDYTKPRLMKDGDLVIVYERHDSLEHMYLSANTIFQNKYGTFPHNEIIGKPFGSKINSKTSSGWLYILEPTPELWSNAVHVSGSVNSSYPDHF